MKYLLHFHLLSPQLHEKKILQNADNIEVEVEIMNAAGGDEFCGTELEEAEGPDFSYTLDADVIVGNDTVPAGTYTEIHCGHHDH